jgi:hypothetical protein
MSEFSSRRTSMPKIVHGHPILALLCIHMFHVTGPTSPLSGEQSGQQAQSQPCT